jgi:hypothetical protein
VNFNVSSVDRCKIEIDVFSVYNGFADRVTNGAVEQRSLQPIVISVIHWYHKTGTVHRDEPRLSSDCSPKRQTKNKEIESGACSN